MLRDLADLIGKTRDMGFVAIVERDQYEDFRRTNPSIVRTAGSPYTLALLSIIDNASQYMKENYPDENIYYWFEAGTENEKETKEFIRRIDDDPRLKTRFRMDGHVFAAKTQACALCAADFLAWEWQRNWWESEEDQKRGVSKSEWRDNFKRLFLDQNSKPIRPIRLGARSMAVRALINSFYNLHRG